MNTFSTLFRSPELESHHQMQFSVIHKIHHFWKDIAFQYKIQPVYFKHHWKWIKKKIYCKEQVQIVVECILRYKSKKKKKWWEGKNDWLLLIYFISNKAIKVLDSKETINVSHGFWWASLAHLMVMWESQNHFSPLLFKFFEWLRHAFLSLYWTDLVFPPSDWYLSPHH